MPTARGSTRNADDVVHSFFDALADRGHEPVFKGESATVRFDVGDGKSKQVWYVTITDGDVAVSHKRRTADVVLRTDESSLAAVVSGRSNGMAAMLRGGITIEGDWGTAVMFARVFPGPPRSTGRVAPITGETVTDQRKAT